MKKLNPLLVLSFNYPPEFQIDFTKIYNHSKLWNKKTICRSTGGFNEFWILSLSK